VFTAGICTTVMWMLLPSCISSVRSDSVNPLTACLAPQYADCNGMERSLSADPTWTMVPRSRVRVVGGSAPSEAHPDDAGAAAAVREWVKEGAQVIVALSTSGAETAHEVAPNVPVLFISTDPTATGLLRDERHP